MNTNNNNNNNKLVIIVKFTKKILISKIKYENKNTKMN